MYIKLFQFLYVSLLVCVAPSLGASSHGPHINRHAELAKRAEGDVQLFKRVANARWTYYNVETGNAGSCGKKHLNTDFTVAMNAAQMNPGWCFKTIRMTQGGKTTTATVTDTCPGCPWGGLDLTEGLFGFFIGHWPQGGGVLAGDWEFTDAAPAKPAPPVTTKAPAPPAPVTSAKPKPKPVTTSKPISTSTKVPTTSKVVPNSSTTASTSIDYLAGVASGLAIPTGTIDRTGSTPSNLEDLNKFLIQVGGLAMAASSI